MRTVSCCKCLRVWCLRHAADPGAECLPDNTPRPFDKKLEEMHLSEKEWRRFAELSKGFEDERRAAKIERRLRRKAGKKYHKVCARHKCHRRTTALLTGGCVTVSGGGRSNLQRRERESPQGATPG